MTKKTLKQSFNTIFHNEEAFEDFCNLDIEKEIERFIVSDKTVYKTSAILKKYLRFIDRVILRHLTIEMDVVHSFTKDKSTLTAVQAHATNKHFFLTDIKSFYPNVKDEDILRILNRDKDRIPISDIGCYISKLVELMTIDGAIPIGFPTSPRLSNSFLFEFDQALHRYCKKKALIYTRYADDIIISGQSFTELSDLKEITQDLLKTHASKQLILNDDKTHITHLGNKVKILGLNILPNGKITIDSKYKKKLELLLHFYVSNPEKYEDFLKQEFRGSEQSLFGMLHYARSIDPFYLEKLQRKYGVYTVRTLMEERWNDNNSR